MYILGILFYVILTVSFLLFNRGCHKALDLSKEDK